MQQRENPELVRRYLLGDLDERQREQIEERLLSDEELQARLSEAEDDLIDDYVLHSLPEREDRLFKQNFFWSPQRQNKLHLSRGLVKYTGDNLANNQEPVATSATAPPRKLSQFLQAKWPAFAVSSAVVLFILGYGGWRVYERWQLENRLSERSRVEQELTRLNSGQLREPHAAIATVTLRPLLRDVGELGRGVINEGIEFLQLKLRLDEDKFLYYRAVIETDEGLGMYTIDGLKAGSDAQSKAITLNLPSRLLPTGNYQIRLIGITADHRPVDIGIYPLQVINR